MAELLQISHWPSLQTCAPVAFSPARSHQQTPATTQRTDQYNCIRIYQTQWRAVIKELSHLQLDATQSKDWRGVTWLMEGCPVVFLFEVVSRPHREEKRLRRLLKVRGMAWFRFLMLLSVRADTCHDDNYRWIIESYDNINTLGRMTF